MLKNFIPANAPSKNYVISAMLRCSEVSQVVNYNYLFMLNFIPSNTLNKIMLTAL